MSTRLAVSPSYKNPEQDREVCPLLHHLFEHQVERAPHAIAVVHDGVELTYEQLNDRANQLAGYLAGCGVGPEIRVGICMERSPEMMIAILGILKAGGGYVPLDPQYPVERLEYIGQDSQLHLVLSREQWFGRLSGLGARVVDVTATYAPESSYPGNWASDACATNLAYTIYTSGSTGLPKGVMVEHGAVVNIVEHVIGACSLKSSDRVLQFCSISWDTSVEEIFPCIASGAALVLRTNAMAESIEAFAAGCKRFKVTVVDLPTAFWQLGMFEAPALIARSIPSLRVVIIGGERADKKALRAWHEQGPNGIKLFNSYGVTEASSISTMCELDGLSGAGPDSYGVPIGEPIRNVVARVLDEDLQCVPDGETGELCISGKGVARGYWKRPHLTAETFVPDPWHHSSGSRMYRSGDLVRRRPDGMLDYVGRRDNQVKVRGVRIELAEIECALNEYEGLDGVAVAARPNLSGDLVIVAYLKSKDTRKIDAGMLRTYLAKKLPAHMIPGAFMWLNRLPLNPNGKLDRAALPSPEWRERYFGTAYAAPESQLQITLAAKWSAILKVEDIGIDDNFFALGGHSLSATHLISWIRERFSLELPIRSIFDRPTVRGLSNVIAESAAMERRNSHQTAISPAERVAPLPLTPAEEMMLLACRQAGVSQALNLCNAARMQGPLNRDALERAFFELTCRHESLRTTFALHEGKPCRVIAPPAPSARPPNEPSPGNTFGDLDLEAERLASCEAKRPFDLDGGPLLRHSLHRLAEDDHLLTITIHHLISDAWSQAVLVKELGALYQAFCEGRPSPLPPLRVQYPDYAVWRRSSLQDGRLAELASFWKRQLSGVQPYLALPVDQPASPASPVQNGKLVFALAPEMTLSLKTFARNRGATLFMVVLAAFVSLLSKLSGETDIAIRVPVSLRNLAELEPLIGLFLDMVVMRFDLSGAPSIDELLRRVSSVTRDSLAHQEMPFQLLMQGMSISGGAKRGSPFPITFNFINTPDDTIELWRLTAKRVAIDEELVSRSSLHLHMQEIAGTLCCTMVYRTELFSPARIADIQEQFEAALSYLLTGPDHAIPDASVASPQYRATA